MVISSYWQFNYNAPGQAGFFLWTHFKYFTSFGITSSLIVRSHSASNSRVSEVSNFVLMMSEAQTAVSYNVVFFSKPSIVIKLPVINMNLKVCSTSGSPDNQAFQACNVCHCLSTLNQSIPTACRVLYLFNSKVLKHGTVGYYISSTRRFLNMELSLLLVGYYISSTRRFLNMELSLLLHQCQKLIYRSAANLLLEVQSQFSKQIK